MRKERKESSGDSFPILPDPLLLTPAQAAHMLQTCVKGVHALCRAGKLPYVRLNGKERRFTREQIETFIAAQIVNGTPPKKNQFDTTPADSLPSHQRTQKGDNSGDKKSSSTSRAELRRELRSWR